MEIAVLAILGVSALAVITFQARQAIKSLLVNETTKCCSCAGCSSSCGICINRDEKGEVE